jgi:trans-aconitate methyltransferase
MQYGTAHAELYDLIFRSRGKDFEAEAEEVARLVRARLPAARSVLDVACGTGAHLETFARLFEHCQGLELAPAMRRIAERRLPRVAVHQSDMRTFELGRAFDAVTCMGNAVACAAGTAELDQTVERMAAHLVPGGVLVVEPWWFPENFVDGHVGGHLMHDAGRIISRTTHSRRQGDRTRMEVKFVVADSRGITEFTDVLSVGLFTHEEYRAAFERAGCAVEFAAGLRLADGRPNSPGLFVGRKEGP